MIVGNEVEMLMVLFNQILSIFQVAYQPSSIMFIHENSNLVSTQVRKSNNTSIHSILLFFLLYPLDRGYKTCAGRPGSLGYEVKDANTYASWGVDYLKLDSCNTNGTPAVVEYSIMRDALNASGRPIFYSLCGMFVNDECFPNNRCITFL